MTFSVDTLSSLPTSVVRAALPDWVASHAELDDGARAALRTRVAALVAEVSDDELDRLRATFRTAGDEYRLYPAEPLARRLTRIYMGALTGAHTLEGTTHLDAFLAGGPRRRLIVANHLSYTDTQATDSLLVAKGYGALADRLVAIAGPKVYTDAWRRMAAIGLNTRKTAQSGAVATEQDALGARELAAVAFATIDDCARLMDEGYVVLLYPEGRRSRTGRLQPFLRASYRYLAIPDLHVLPMAQTGTERMFPIDAELMRVVPTRLGFGPAFRAADHPGKTGALEEAHRRVAAVLPPAYRPQDGEPRVG